MREVLGVLGHQVGLVQGIGAEINLVFPLGSHMQDIPRLVDAQPEDAALLGHLLLTANKVAKQLGVGDAFRLAVNNGADAGQSVFHLHLHILAGRAFKWPPG